MCKRGTSSITDYLNRFKAIFELLAAIQKSVSDDDKVMYILDGLDMVFVTSVSMRVPFPPFSELRSLLLGARYKSMPAPPISQFFQFDGRALLSRFGCSLRVYYITSIHESHLSNLFILYPRIPLTLCLLFGSYPTKAAPTGGSKDWEGRGFSSFAIGYRVGRKGQQSSFLR